MEVGKTMVTKTRVEVGLNHRGRQRRGSVTVLGKSDTSLVTSIMRKINKETRNEKIKARQM